MHTEIGTIFVMKQNVFLKYLVLEILCFSFLCSDKAVVSMLAKSMLAGVLLPSILANDCALNSGAGPYNAATSLFHRM